MAGRVPPSGSRSLNLSKVFCAEIEQLLTIMALNRSVEMQEDRLACEASGLGLQGSRREVEGGKYFNRRNVIG